jgi:type I restriction enzyme M protein
MNSMLNKEIHEIHNYIRDNTKISNEDKPFFISIILISIQKESFKLLIKEYNGDKYIYDILKYGLIDYDIDTTIFEFFRNYSNNKHFLNIINMVLNIFNSHYTIDLINIFYGEFVKYTNQDGKTLGIVLTPPHIIEVMVKFLDINEDDIILDLCTGTGSFLIESIKYNPKLIIGCEYQNKLFTLLKCNMILHNITNYKIIKGDCFEHPFKATKSIINPPYGQKIIKEIDFIIKQLNSIEEGGISISIIPTSIINNINERNKLIPSCKIKTIINCTNKTFYPYASVGVCILILEKNKKGHDFNRDKVNIIDFTNDGIIRNRNQK